MSQNRMARKAKVRHQDRGGYAPHAYIRYGRMTAEELAESAAAKAAVAKGRADALAAHTRRIRRKLKIREDDA